ncbi:MAG: hypothetical protein Hyperionvirus7_31 [Hyperionvirus sp.]|uniref:Uncharacterized protein n=1 Tax=Hyperionvirus sp. TaxID=2487770 RepID=A0A3G5A837_9VIRU|nr:MAG: hypothetical protein Hyperionvirus7_31 [Hyperionvirus sp.]
MRDNCSGETGNNTPLQWQCFSGYAARYVGVSDRPPLLM